MACDLYYIFLARRGLRRLVMSPAHNVAPFNNGDLVSPGSLPRVAPNVGAIPGALAYRVIAPKA
jgi:hypothetical protein